MQYVQLGRAGLRVSRLCLGTMNMGVGASEADSFAIMDRALELGINFFDTADRYGQPQCYGYTEELVGRWLAQGGRRDKIVLGTKVFGPMGPGVNNRGLSAYHIRRGCADSLRRLQTDHIDLYQMHHIDLGVIAPHQQAMVGADVRLYDPPHITPGTPMLEIWQAMGQLIREGKITYVGSSNFAAWNVVRACDAADRLGLLGLVSEQSVYNLTMRHVELELLPACRAYGVGFMCWSPLGGGLLAGALEQAAQGRRANLRLSEARRAQIQAYEDLCRELGEAPATVALAWLLNNPVVTTPIVGPRTVAQLESALRAPEVTLSADVLGRLDALFPGLGGAAPMAYAW
ncbi:MAG: aldo/keto reductase [Chloroflexota bacterium]